MLRLLFLSLLLLSGTMWSFSWTVLWPFNSTFPEDLEDYERERRSTAFLIFLPLVLPKLSGQVSITSYCSHSFFSIIFWHNSYLYKNFHKPFIQMYPFLSFAPFLIFLPQFQPQNIRFTLVFFFFYIFIMPLTMKNTFAFMFNIFFACLRMCSIQKKWFQNFYPVTLQKQNNKSSVPICRIFSFLGKIYTQ